MAYNNIHGQFSPKSDNFAYVGPDGVLKIWDTSSQRLLQEYTPSSHLSATCSSFAWCPCKHHVNSPKKKAKRAKSCRMSEGIAELNLIAMGTLSGEVLLYSVAKGDIHTKLQGGHSSTVNGIAWLSDEDALFTCSNDLNIVRWSISKGKVVTKWKAGKSAVRSICAIDSNNLLSASSSIFWWDINTQTIIKKFTGHATEVSNLLTINVVENTNILRYFVSAAVGDRVVNIWQIDKKSDGNAIASFLLSDEPTLVNVSDTTDKSKPLTVSIVTKEGKLHVFEHQLNGKLHKPLLPKSTVQIASITRNAETKSRPLSILASRIEDDSSSCSIAYGNFLRPRFEKLDFSDLQKETFLIRETVSSIVAEENATKIIEPERPSNAKILAPGFMTPAKPTDGNQKKKKRKTENESELPMEERLNAMYLDKTQEEQVETPQNSESMVHLLLQGLQSNDTNLLNTVLRKSDEDIIRITVKRLPLNSIPLLLKELHKRLTTRDPGNRPCLRWLKAVLCSHLSYLMSLKDIGEYIGPVSQLIEAREETFSKMAQLKGFLDILWFQINSKSKQDSCVAREPLAVYHDESSEEEEEENAMDHLDGLSNDGELKTSESESEDEEPSNSSSESD